MVARIDKEGVTQVPGNMALGATGNPAYTLECAQILGHELKSIGIDMNLAPVLDVNNNFLNPVIGVRSYGENAESVAAHGAAAIKDISPEVLLRQPNIFQDMEIRRLILILAWSLYLMTVTGWRRWSFCRSDGLLRPEWMPL